MKYALSRVHLNCRAAALAALLGAAPLLPAQEFEAGTVVASQPGRMGMNAIPQVARLGNGDLFAVWCAGPVGSEHLHIYGATSGDGGRSWSPPRVLFQDAAKTDADPNILADGDRVFVFSTRVAVPNRIDKSWILMIRSEDDARTWSAPEEVFIPRQYVSGKQHNGIRLFDGTYLFGISWDKWPEMGLAARTEGEMDITAGVLLSKDAHHWTLHGALHAFVDKATPGSTNGLDEPSFVQLADGSLYMLLRSGATHHYESRSTDGGMTWSEPAPSPLPGHNTPSALWRLAENPGEIVVVWNNSPLARTPLSAALSADGGRAWSHPRKITDGGGFQVSYPGITETTDHHLVAVWQQQLPSGGRDIRWARFTRDWILAGRARPPGGPVGFR